MTNIEQVMPVKLAQALANPLFPALDGAPCARAVISVSTSWIIIAFLMDFQDYLEEFYARYNVELIRAPEGFFYLRPRSTTLISRSVLSELDMMVGKILCYLYLSPERLANEGIFTQQELYDELLTPADESRLLKLVNNRSTGSDLDRQKLQEKMRASLNRLRVVWGWCGLWATIAASFALPNRYSALAPMCAPATTRAKRSAV
ncbi:chromosome partition protein MukE [Klebsiella pneumoniae subsp. pneumoniae]|nr:chromosome partition protein MukE [Klebsiella pneumoniae subsp. pneumoniae]